MNLELLLFADGSKVREAFFVEVILRDQTKALYGLKGCHVARVFKWEVGIAERRDKEKAQLE